LSPRMFCPKDVLSQAIIPQGLFVSGDVSENVLSYDGLSHDVLSEYPFICLLFTDIFLILYVSDFRAILLNIHISHIETNALDVSYYIKQCFSDFIT
jgi:hypothetical protein